MPRWSPYKWRPSVQIVAPARHRRPRYRIGRSTVATKPNALPSGLHNRRSAARMSLLRRSGRRRRAGARSCVGRKPLVRSPLPLCMESESGADHDTRPTSSKRDPEVGSLEWPTTTSATTSAPSGASVSAPPPGTSGPPGPIARPPTRPSCSASPGKLRITALMLDGMKPPLTTSGVGPIKRLDGEEHIRTLSLPAQYSRGARAVASGTRGDHLLAEHRSIRAPALHGRRQ